MNTEHHGLSGFTSVDIRGAFKFEVARSDQYGVDIDRKFKQTKVFTSGGELVISHPWYDVLGWFTPWVRPVATIRMPELHTLKVAGASTGSAKGFTSSSDFKLEVRGASQVDTEVAASRADIDVAGASKIELAISVREMKLQAAGASSITGSVKADKGEINVSGASKIVFNGGMDGAVINVEGASRVDMEAFKVRNPNIKVRGASRCTINVEGRMDVDLAGASRLEYIGEPAMGSVRSVGASTLARR